MESKKIILALAVKYQGEWEKIYNAMSTKEYQNLDEQFVEETYEQFKGRFITILDKEYPDNLKQVYKPPFVLFYEGNINVLNNENVKIAISDSRNLETSERDVAMSMLSNLPNKSILILGGEGELSKKETLSNTQIMVLGYNPSNCDNQLKQKVLGNGGVIISESPLNERNKDMLASRYRIMSGLCDKVFILTPVKKISGINMLVAIALTQGKDVMVIPQTPTPKDDSINNELIYQGAIPVYNQQTLCDNLS